MPEPGFRCSWQKRNHEGEFAALKRCAYRMDCGAEHADCDSLAMLTGLDHQNNPDDTAATAAGSCERVWKLIARLGDRSNSNEARLVLPAVNKALEAAQWDWHDVAEAVRKQMEEDGKPRKPLRWVQLSAAARGRSLMAMAKSEFFSPEELHVICDLADKFCLVPGNRHPESDAFMEAILVRWRANGKA
jgi:hypothetical protein